MKRISKVLAVVLTAALLLSLFAVIPSSAATDTVINNLAISAHNSQYSLTEVYVYLSSPFVKGYNHLQSFEHADGSPSEEFCDALVNCIKINDKTIAKWIEENQWWNAVVISVGAYGSTEMIAFQLHDGAFGGDISLQDFTIEFCEGALDSSCNPIAPHKYQYFAQTRTFADYVKPDTTFTAMSIADFPDYGMAQLYLTTDEDYTATYSELQSAEQSAATNPSQDLLDTFSNYVKINDKTVAECMDGFQWWNAVRVYIDGTGEEASKERYTFYLYNDAFGGSSMVGQDFTFEFLKGAKDASGNPIKPAKYQYTAATQSFVEVKPEVEKTHVTGLNLSYAKTETYALSELTIGLDAAYVKQYYGINTGIADPTPPQCLLNTVKNCIRINGKSLATIGGTIYSHLYSLNGEGEYQVFDIMIYDNVLGTPLYDNDFILDIVDGATDSEGNPIAPCSYQYSAADHTFTEHEYVDVSVEEFEVLDMSAYDLTEVVVLLDATDHVELGDLQSRENATGDPSEQLFDAVANYILINDQPVKDLIKDYQWWNAVRVSYRFNGTNEIIDIYLYDAAFGGHLYDEDFTIEFAEGAIDGVGNPIVPCKYQYLAEDQEFVPYTEPALVAGLSLNDVPSLGLTQLFLDLDSDFVAQYININSGIADPTPSDDLLTTVTEKILINDQSVNEIKAATGGAIWCNLTNYGGKQRIELQVYYGASGGISLVDQNFTVATISGAKDTEGKRIATGKYQYNASAKSFSKYVAPANVTGVAVADASAYGLAQVYVRTDAPFVKNFININSGIADPTPSAELLNTVCNCIRINGMSVDEIKAATGGAIWCNLTGYGNYQQFELQVYYTATGGTTLAAQDFTIEVVDGATSSQGALLAPYKKQFNAATGTATDFNATTMVMMRKDLLGSKTNKSFDLNGDGAYDVRDLVRLSKMIAE